MMINKIYRLNASHHSVNSGFPLSPLRYIHSLITIFNLH